MKYDAIIIGSGIGGLVCASYLAKAGLKVLVVEQHCIPGGYCTSFRRNGHIFDVGVHYLGGIKKGVLGTILRELELIDQIKFKQFDPADKIIMPDNTTFIRANWHDTVNGFKKCFLREKNNLDVFFKFITQENIVDIYKKTKNLTFKQLLNEFFKDDRLKATLGILLGNIGTSFKVAPAFTGIVMYRQYISDPGYYPQGGMQKLPDVLARSIKQNKGNVLLSKKVTQIVTKSNKVEGIVLDGGERFYADIIISNADGTQTFKELLNIKCKEKEAVDKLLPAPSLFLLYLGLRADFKDLINCESNIWYFSTYQVHRVHSNIKKNILQNKLPWIICSFPSLHDAPSKSEAITATLLVLAPYERFQFWDSYRDVLAEKMLDKISEVIPNFKNFVNFKNSATPITLHRYTLNRAGSFVGWLSSVHQAKSHFLPQVSSIKGLYLVGTWCTAGYPGQGGIPNVAASGRRGAMLVLRDMGRNWGFDNIKL